MKIYVKSRALDGTVITIPLEVYSMTTIGDVKVMISKYGKCHPIVQTLYDNEHRFYNEDSRTLESYNIKDGSTIFLSVG